MIDDTARCKDTARRRLRSPTRHFLYIFIYVCSLLSLLRLASGFALGSNSLEPKTSFGRSRSSRLEHAAGSKRRRASRCHCSHMRWNLRAPHCESGLVGELFLFGRTGQNAPCRLDWPSVTCKETCYLDLILLYLLFEDCSQTVKRSARCLFAGPLRALASCAPEEAT